MHGRRFQIRYTGLGKAMVVLGLAPANSFVEVDTTVIRVRMGWAFRGTVARSSVRSVAEDTERVLGWGVHGWRGKWLVNGSSSGIVRLDIDPEARVRVIGVPLRLRTLRVSVDDPGGLRAALISSS